MTSTSAKINTPILHQFIDCNRDIMPACVATSYQRIGNEPYQREYTRDETGHISESSSPDTPKYEDNYKSQIQCPQSSQYSGRLTDGSLNFPLVSGSRAKHEKPFRTSSHGTSTPPKVHSHNDSRKNNYYAKKQVDSEIPRNNFPAKEEVNQESPSGHVTAASSPKQSHPLKKRILQNTESDLKDAAKCSHTNSKPSNHTSTKTTESNSQKTKSSDHETSSEILQKMYASFGPSLNSHFSKVNPFNKLRDVSSVNSQDEDNCGIQHHYQQSLVEESSSPEKSSPRGPSANKNEYDANHRSGKRLSMSRNKPVGDMSRNIGRFIDPTAADGEGTEYQSIPNSSRPKSSQTRNKSSKKSPKKRKCSSELTSSHTSRFCDLRGNQQDATSPVESTKRVRYSSTDSNDSQTRHDRKSLPNLYKQNGSWLPFVNPLLYPQTSFNPLAMPNNGCNFPIPSYSQPNPLMFASNPYLANSVMMREMMNSAGIANLMPLLPNTNFPPIPGANGVSPQQLQALQQLQSAMLCQNMSPFQSNNYQPPPGMLPLIQNPLLAANRHMTSLAHSSTDSKAALTNRSPSPFDAPSKVSTDIKKSSSYPNHIQPPHFSNTMRRKKKPLGRQKNHLTPGSDDSSSPNEISKQRLFHQKRFLLNNSKDEDSPKLHQKFLSQTAKTSSKKRSEKRTKDSSKSKDTSGQKLATNESSSPSLMKQANHKPEELTNILIDSPPPSDCQSVKPSSYKNLTRERRLVANARERTRVHTISSAFDELRAQIPSYSCNQKLSKLAILRIACEYIRTLSVLADDDEPVTFAQGVDQCTRVLQSESRARSRRKNNKAQIEMEMENYERHRSQEEDSDSLDGASVTTPSQARIPMPSYMPHDLFSNSIDNDGTNKTPSTTDDVYHDVIETDNDIVDVESVDDDTVFTEQAHAQTTTKSDISSTRSNPASPAPHLSLRCADEATQLDTRSTEIVVE